MLFLLRKICLQLRLFARIGFCFIFTINLSPTIKNMLKKRFTRFFNENVHTVLLQKGYIIIL